MRAVRLANPKCITISDTAGPGNPVTTSQYLDPSFLDGYVTAANLAASAVNKFRSDTGAAPMLWMGETSGAGGATRGAHLVIGRFLGVFWFADKLGAAAATGHSVVCKQQYQYQAFSVNADGSGVSASPEYWLALAWRNFMLGGVLRVSGGGGLVRVYASLQQPDRDAGWKPGQISVVVINLGATAAKVPLKVSGGADAKSHHLHSLTAFPDATDMQSNRTAWDGKELQLKPDGTPPFPLDGRSKPVDGTVATVPPRSVSFVVLSQQAAAEEAPRAGHESALGQSASPPDPEGDGFSFHSAFGDSMVLQHAGSSGARAAVFGSGCGGKVSLTMDGKPLTAPSTPAAGGAWRMSLPPMPPTSVGEAGVELVATCATSGATATLRDVVFGDVYVTSESSNGRPHLATPAPLLTPPVAVNRRSEQYGAAVRAHIQLLEQLRQRDLLHTARDPRDEGAPQPAAGANGDAGCAAHVVASELDGCGRALRDLVLLCEGAAGAHGSGQAAGADRHHRDVVGRVRATHFHCLRSGIRCVKNERKSAAVAGRLSRAGLRPQRRRHAPTGSAGRTRPT